MVQWNKITWLSQILAIVLGILIFWLGFYAGSLKEVPPTSDEIWYTNSIDKENSVKEMSNISFKGLTSGVKKLPPLPTEDEWNNILDNKGVFRQRLEEDFSKHGDIVKRFYASEDYEYYYIDVVIADLTADGVPEQILSFDGGGTYGIIKYEIISGEEIIVTIEPQSVGRSGAFQPHDTGNGFSVIWYTEDMFPNGYCCPVEQITTTFKYEDMKFIAIEEKSESATY